MKNSFSLSWYCNINSYKYFFIIAEKNSIDNNEMSKICVKNIVLCHEY